MNSLDCPLMVQINSSDWLTVNASSNYIFYDLKSGQDYDLTVQAKDCFNQSTIDFGDEKTFSFTALDEHVSEIYI
jgi:hypothetical protein